jgi:hypothetical protein
MVMSEILNVYEYWLPDDFIISSVSKVVELYKETKAQLEIINDPGAIIIWRASNE